MNLKLKGYVVRSLAISALAFATACGGGGASGTKNGQKLTRAEPEFHGSCNQPLMSTCNEYIGTGWNFGGMPPRCGMGAADPNPCPRENVIGRCSFLEAPLDADSRTYYYVGASYQEDDVALLQSVCVDTMKGIFEEL